MAAPEKPDLDFSFTGFQQGQGNNAFPGTQLDNALAVLANAIGQIIDFQNGVIRSDGKLQNGVVTNTSLDAGVQLGLPTARPWAPAVPYAVDVTVTVGSGLYVCLVDHVSSVFATDLASMLWAKIFELPSPLPVADGSITGPKLADGSVTNAKVPDGEIEAAKLAGNIPQSKLAATVGVVPVGAEMDFAGAVAPAGWLFEYGQTVSRVAYSALMGVIAPSAVGTTTNTSSTVTAVGFDFRNLGLEGAKIEGAGIPAGATIVSITSTTIVLSVNATASATGTIRIFPHGNGDGATTFTLPDARDVAPIGRGNMGGVAAGRISASGAGNPGLNTARLGLLGGVDRHALLVAQLPIVTPAGSVATTLSDAILPNDRAKVGGTGTPNQGGFWFGNSATANTAASVFAGTPFGGGEAHPNLQPSRVTNRIIFTGVV